jgi:hypothetical protein
MLAKPAHDYEVDWPGVQIVGGYGLGKVPPGLWAFATTFQHQFGFALDPIYKMPKACTASQTWNGHLGPSKRILIYRAGGVPTVPLFE